MWPFDEGSDRASSSEETRSDSSSDDDDAVSTNSGQGNHHRHVQSSGVQIKKTRVSAAYELYTNLKKRLADQVGPELHKQLDNVCVQWMWEHLESRKEGRPAMTVSTTFELSVSPDEKFTLTCGRVNYETMEAAIAADAECADVSLTQNEEEIQENESGHDAAEKESIPCGEELLTPEVTPKRCTSEDKEVRRSGSTSLLSSAVNSMRKMVSFTINSPASTLNSPVSTVFSDESPPSSPLTTVDPWVSDIESLNPRLRTLSNISSPDQFNLFAKRMKLDSDLISDSPTQLKSTPMSPLAPLSPRPVQPPTATSTVTAASPESSLPEFTIEFLNCFKCSSLLKSEDELKEHLLKVHSITEHFCPVDRCNMESFPSRFDLLRHLNTMHSQHENDWTCCDLRFSLLRFNAFTGHHRLAHTIGSFRCSVEGCKFTESTRIGVYMHWKQCHLQKKAAKRLKYIAKKLECFVEMCSESFISLDQLDTHLQTVHKKSINQIECPICYVGFDEFETLSSHLENVHHDTCGPWACRICGQIVQLTTLASHFSLNHMIGVFQCSHRPKPPQNWCNLKFDNRAKVIAHYNQAHNSNK